MCHCSVQTAIYVFECGVDGHTVAKTVRALDWPITITSGDAQRKKTIDLLLNWYWYHCQAIKFIGFILYSDQTIWFFSFVLRATRHGDVWYSLEAFLLIRMIERRSRLDGLVSDHLLSGCTEIQAFWDFQVWKLFPSVTLILWLETI